MKQVPATTAGSQETWSDGILKAVLLHIKVGGEGHVTPLMHLCVFLAKQHGFSVTFAPLALAGGGAANIYELVRLKGTWPPPDLDISLVGLNTEVPLPELALTDIAAFEMHARTYQVHLEEIVQGLLPNVACIISDYLLGWCLDVAHKFGIPGVLLFTGSVAWSWFELQMPRLCSAELVPMQPQDQEIDEEENTVVLDNPFNLQKSDIPRQFWNCKSWQEFTVTYLSDGFKRASWTLINSCRELEEELLNYMVEEIGPNFVPVGPLFLLHDDDEAASRAGLRKCDFDCLQWLDKQPPSSVLYIAFGSIATLSPEQLEEIASALEASKQKFLWVIREAPVSERLSERFREQGLIVSWTPQTLVLSHSSVGGFLSHCGWNSTLDALSNGKPVLCWPVLYDQQLNSKHIVEKWEAGKKFTKSSSNSSIVDRVEVERVIRMVMQQEEGNTLRSRAKKLGQEMKKSLEQSCKNLDTFAREVRLRFENSKVSRFQAPQVKPIPDTHLETTPCLETSHATSTKGGPPFNPAPPATSLPKLEAKHPDQPKTRINGTPEIHRDSRELEPGTGGARS